MSAIKHDSTSDGEEIDTLNKSLEYEPTDEEINQQAMFLGINPVTDKDLLHLAKESLKAPMPTDWKTFKNSEGEIYYKNIKTGEKSQDHPVDVEYRASVKSLKTERRSQTVKSLSHLIHHDPNPLHEPTEDEISNYAVYLGMNLIEDEKYRKLARDGLMEPLPAEWSVVQNNDGTLKYRNSKTNEETDDHPIDIKYKQKFKELKQKEINDEENLKNLREEKSCFCF